MPKNNKLTDLFYRTPSLALLCLLLGVSSLFSQSRERTEHWQTRNQQFNTEMDSIGHPDNVFLGNSITEGFDLETLFPGHELANRGIAGDHLDGLIQRLENSALSLEPEKLFLMIGINDIGDKRSDEYLKSMFITLIDTLVTGLPETEIYLHSILPTSPRWKNCPPDQIKRINNFLALLAKENELVFINLYPDFLGDMKYINPDLARDGLHPNQAGYQIWAEKIQDYLE